MMKCVKCRKQIPDKSKFCNFCGTKQEKQKLYRRSDGLYEKIMIINGKRKAFRGKTEKEVMQKILNYNENLEKGELFKTVAKQWHDEHFPTLAYTTQKGYKSAYDEIVDEFGEDYIKEIAPHHINRFIKGLPKTYAKKTCKTRLIVLNQIFKFAVVNEFCENNPATYVQVDKNRSEKHRRAPDEKEIGIIKNSIDLTYRDFKVGLFAYMLLYTGMRKGEALALQKNDIDLKNSRLKISKSVFYESTNPYIKQPKTEAGRREIIIPKILVDKLQAIVKKLKKNSFLFFSENPLQPINGSVYDYAWEFWQKQTGLNDITAHMLRHGYATVLFEADIAPKDAQDLLGHADIQTTFNRYTHISKTHKTAVEEKLNNYLNTEITQ